MRCVYNSRATYAGATQCVGSVLNEGDGPLKGKAHHLLPATLV